MRMDSLTISGRDIPLDAAGKSQPALEIRSPKTYNPSDPAADPRDHSSSNNIIARFLRVRRYEEITDTDDDGKVDTGTDLDGDGEIDQITDDHLPPLADTFYDAKNTGGDALAVQSVSDLIIDHCSFAWGDDGSADITQHKTPDNEQPEMDVTLQWCLIAQTLRPHSKASLLWGKYGSRYSVLNNLYAHNNHRNPEFGWVGDETGDTAPEFTDPTICLLDFSGNVIYNWGAVDGSTPAPGQANEDAGITQESDKDHLRLYFTNNCYKPGHQPTPATEGDNSPGNATPDDWVAFRIHSDCSAHFSGNTTAGVAWSDPFEHVEWSGKGIPLIGISVDEEDTMVVEARYPTPSLGGAGALLPLPDALDTAAADVSGTGSLAQIAVPGHTLTAGAVGGFTDTDADGMDDIWETPYAPDRDHTDFHPWADGDGDGWTNLEEFLNGTDPTVGNDPMEMTDALPTIPTIPTIPTSN